MNPVHCISVLIMRKCLKRRNLIYVSLLKVCDYETEAIFPSSIQLSYLLKEKYLSKALTCTKCFMYKQNSFYQIEGYLSSHCCMNNLYISHRSLYAPTYSFLTICSMLISLLRVTSWFDTVCNSVTRWVNFREHHLHEHKL